MSIRRLDARYAAARGRLAQRASAAATATGVDVTREADVLGKRFGILRKPRAASEYAEVAGHLLGNYPAELAYFVAVEITEQFERRLGYPPIGQIMVALQEKGGKDAAGWIGCALRNFPKVETAQLAFGVIRSADMRSLVRADLAAEDSELADYISAGETVAPAPDHQPAPPELEHQTKEDRERNPEEELSDGIERMPRKLTGLERRGDRLFLHLQAVSFVALVLLPILGGVLRGWAGAALGGLAGWFVRTWMRRSMGLRGSNPHDGFFVRMRERANGSRRGVLEALIERARGRPFTQEQCAAMTQARDETIQRLASAISAEEKRALVSELDERIKRISYGLKG